MKKVFAAISAAALILAPLKTPLEALKANASDVNPYLDMVQTVERVGIEFKLNPPKCDTIAEESGMPHIFGWYYVGNRELVICQQNRIKGSTKPVEWTAEDFDTLRHETHHLIQDCVDGVIDGSMTSVYHQPLELSREVLTTEHIGQILKLYKDFPSNVKVLELEAFSVAAMNDPVEQVKDLKTYCLGE